MGYITNISIINQQYYTWMCLEIMYTPLDWLFTVPVMGNSWWQINGFRGTLSLDRAYGKPNKKPTWMWFWSRIVLVLSLLAGFHIMSVRALLILGIKIWKEPDEIHLICKSAIICPLNIGLSQKKNETPSSFNFCIPCLQTSRSSQNGRPGAPHHNRSAASPCQSAVSMTLKI